MQKDATETYRIKQASEILGVSVYTLKYYCKIGLVSHIPRADNGYRIFSEEQLNWLAKVIALRKCGFSTKDLRKYKQLVVAGESAKAERKAFLETRRRQIWQELERAQENIGFLERELEVLSR